MVIERQELIINSFSVSYLCYVIPNVSLFGSLSKFSWKCGSSLMPFPFLHFYPLLGLQTQLSQVHGWNMTPVHPFALHRKRREEKTQTYNLQNLQNLQHKRRKRTIFIYEKPILVPHLCQWISTKILATISIHTMRHMADTIWNSTVIWFIFLFIWLL
jgi:hypothetical protein